MADTIGRLKTIGIARQTGRGSAGTADFWLRKLSFSNGRNVEHLNDESALGNTAETSGIDVARQWAEPTMSTYLDLAPQGLIEWVNADTYSVSANADVSGVVYDHVFKVGTATYPENFITINTDDPTEGDQNFVDAIINSISMNFAINARVNTDLNLVSKYPVAQASTPAFTTPQYFLGRHITVEIDDTVDDFNTSVFGATQVGFERTNNVDTGETTAFQLGNPDIADHRMQSRSATLTVSKIQEDNTYSALELAGTHKAVRITIVDTATTIGTAANPSYTITFPKCSVKAVQTEDNNTRRTEELSITPHYGLDNDESASYLYKVEITNLVATYATI